jgi:hypothetical protein
MSVAARADNFGASFWPVGIAKQSPSTAMVRPGLRLLFIARSRKELQLEYLVMDSSLSKSTVRMRFVLLIITLFRTFRAELLDPTSNGRDGPSECLKIIFDAWKMLGSKYVI